MAESTIPAPVEQEQQTLVPQEDTRALEHYVAPSVDIFEAQDGLTVVVDLPGIPRENLDIEVKENLLTIVGRAPKNERGASLYREFELVNFFRQFRLADTVDVNRIQADLKHGVLTLRLPKAEEAKPKKIAVQVG